MISELINNQLKQLSEFTANLGLVFLATVIAPLFSNVDKVDLLSVILGLVIMLISLAISLLLLKEVET